MKRALVTGVKGLIGTYLARDLLKKKFRVIGLDHNLSKSSNLNDIKSKIKLFECDILDKDWLSFVIKKSNPDYIFHLAGITKSVSNETFFQVNVIGTLNILETLVELKINPTTVIACSSAEYGQVSRYNLPITEKTPLRPITPYGKSKVIQDLQSYLYFRVHGLKIIRVRIFNNTAPMQKEDYVCSSFAKQIVGAGSEAKLKAGNLYPVRDFLDTRDVAKAIALAAFKGKTGEVYNIASGKGRSMRNILDELITQSGRKVRITSEKNRIQKLDIPRQIGSYRKLFKHTGWRPKIDFNNTLGDLLAFWKNSLTKSRN